MPYIDKESRKEIDLALDTLINILPTALGADIKDGDVNYVISKIMNKFYNKPSYSILNRGIGVLECVKLEFYRRVVEPYEDKKKDENGDVYK